ncbi:hypothetical protein [Nostoc sp. UHCC 0870]|uniref:hypothetical protein n=1 Tax=Nostoc sp. UHCC 0870 TaxID=2914041 RepID=UPI001EDE7EA8|nr:hypothetical protein [Nostoc sp. UHCC 0870]UKP01217.1 hypothetical protein L6494_28325 [Nostoc sp. UHCC 0870]
MAIYQVHVVAERIAQCLRSNPKAGQRLLGDIDLNKYTTNSIPGLRQTPIRQFKQWQRTYINQVPGLNKVPFSQMPNPLKSGTSVVGIASTVFGKSEKRRSDGRGWLLRFPVVLSGRQHQI